MTQYPDKAIVWAYQSIYEPMFNKSDNTWFVNYKQNGEWKQKSFITRDGAWMFYYEKIHEFKEYFTKLIMQRSK